MKFKLCQTYQIASIDGCCELQNFEATVVGIVHEAGLPTYVDVDSWETESFIWVGLLLPDGEIAYVPEDVINLA